MRFISWNCRGVRNSRFRRSCKDLLRQQQPDVMCFLETKTSSDISSMRFMPSLGFDKNYQVPAAGFAGGLWVFWKSNKINLEVVFSTSQLVNCSFLQNNKLVFITFVYVQPNPRHKDMFWKDLNNISVVISSPWTVDEMFSCKCTGSLQ